MPSDKILMRKEGAVGHLIVNNPERHNAISLDMWSAAGEILADLAGDPAIRAVVLSGAGGRAFASGADISKFESERASQEAVEAYNKQTHRVHEALATLAKPTIAMIRGYCIGGGLALALDCDMRIASDVSKFGVPAAKLGLGYGHGGIRRLIDLVGPAVAKEIFFTDKQFTAGEAHAMGLINRVVADGELEIFVADYAKRIAENAPLTIAQIKRTVAELMKDPADRDLALCDRLVADCFASQDYVEGRRAFMEKRKPAFVGR